MTKQAVVSNNIAPAVGPFSPAIASGTMLYLSGQVGQDPATGKLIEGDASAQTEQIIANLKAVLAAGGKSLAEVVRVGVYLTSMADYPAMNAVYGKHFQAPYPARSTICVAALPLGAKVEIDLIAI